MPVFERSRFPEVALALFRVATLRMVLKSRTPSAYIAHPRCWGTPWPTCPTLCVPGSIRAEWRWTERRPNEAARRAKQVRLTGLVTRQHLPSLRERAQSNAGAECMPVCLSVCLPSAVEASSLKQRRPQPFYNSNSPGAALSPTAERARRALQVTTLDIHHQLRARLLGS
jgi:hypothetical protein